MTHDETEKRKTEEVKKLSGEIGATNERSVAAHAAENLYPDAPSSSSTGELSLPSPDTQAGFQLLESDRFPFAVLNIRVIQLRSKQSSRFKTREGKRVVFHARLGAN